MRIVYAIGILVALVAGVFLVGGQFLPDKLVISRSGDFCHSPKQIYRVMTTPQEIAEWSLFSREAKIPVTYSDTGGTGGWVKWTADDGDSIELRISRADTAEAVDYAVNLGDTIKVATEARIAPPVEGNAKVRLDLHIQPESISGRWGMMLAFWAPGGQSFADLLDEEIRGLQAHLAEQLGQCKSEPIVVE